MTIGNFKTINLFSRLGLLLPLILGYAIYIVNLAENLSYMRNLLSHMSYDFRNSQFSLFVRHLYLELYIDTNLLCNIHGHIIWSYAIFALV